MQKEARRSAGLEPQSFHQRKCEGCAPVTNWPKAKRAQTSSIFHTITPLGHIGQLARWGKIIGKNQMFWPFGPPYGPAGPPVGWIWILHVLVSHCRSCQVVEACWQGRRRDARP